MEPRSSSKFIAAPVCSFLLALETDSIPWSIDWFKGKLVFLSLRFQVSNSSFNKFNSSHRALFFQFYALGIRRKLSHSIANLAASTGSGYPSPRLSLGDSIFHSRVIPFLLVLHRYSYSTALHRSDISINQQHSRFFCFCPKTKVTLECWGLLQRFFYILGLLVLFSKLNRLFEIPIALLQYLACFQFGLDYVVKQQQLQL